MMELNFRTFDDRSKQFWAAIRRRFFQVRVAALHVSTENLRNPGRRSEVGDGLVDVVGQIAAAFTQVVVVGNFAIDSGLEDRTVLGRKHAVYPLLAIWRHSNL
jgi:hypothetical protein